MKIRADFVTNSSSSSYVTVNFDGEKLNEIMEPYVDILTEVYSDLDLDFDDGLSLRLEETFMNALNQNPESVKALLAGENGILSMMEDTVEQSLKASTGYFDIKTSTLDSNIKKTNEKITNKNKSIETYKSQLESKFYAMEQMIASMQQNYQSFLS